jgi:branched-chain amino acid transport system ATP-binding protein
MNPLARLKQHFVGATGGDPIFPLAILFAIFFFDEFDTAAMYTLAPDIRHAFHLSTEGFGAVVVVNFLFVVVLAIPVGYYGDRFSRRLLIVTGAVIAGVFSFLTGVVGALGLLVVVRIMNGMGRLVNDPIHSSLLSDTYKPEHRPRVFEVHRNAVPIGAILGALIAGSVAALLGWRAAFLLLIVPIVICAFLALRLVEPARGATDDPDAAAQAADEQPVPFRQAARMLMSVPTLKRQYWSYILFGMGLVPLAIYLPLYLDEVWHLGPFQRALVNGANAFATYLGISWSGRRTQGWLAQGLGEPLKRSGRLIAILGPGLFLVAVSPVLALAIAFGLVTSFFAGTYLPPFLTVQALVSPARVRSFSFSFGALFSLIGAFVFLLSPLGRLADAQGIRFGIGATAPWFVIGGLVLASAHRFVTSDTERAFRALQTTVELRRERADQDASPSLLKIAGLDVGYDGVQVLFDVDLDVRQGEILALLGTNGAGKSTLLKAISGLNPPTSGIVLFDGNDITAADVGRTASLGIAQVPGGRGIFPSLTVAENIRAGGWMYRGQKGYLEEVTERVLEYFPVLRERWDTQAGALSGGEQQMLSLAQAFIAKPKLLMIDELSLGLAPTIVERLLDIVRAIHANGTTVILVEQSVNVALRIADRAVFMEKGEIRFSGPTADLLERGDILRAVFLKGGEAAKGASAKAAASRRAELLAGPVVLETRGLTKSYGGVKAVNDVSIQLHRGEILGLLGPNGAGKTSIFDLISGFQKPDGGHVILDGVDITQWPAWRRAEEGLARSFQDARLWPSLTVRDAIAVSLKKAATVRSPLPAMLDLPVWRESEAVIDARVEELVEMLGLGAFRDKFVSELSTGSRRMVEIATLLSMQPKVIVLDEPSSGIAQKETEALGPVLREVQRHLDCAILIIEHDMPLISSLADHIVALELGTVIAHGTPSEILNHPRVIESYLGNASYTELQQTSAKGTSGTRRSTRQLRARQSA